MALSKAALAALLVTVVWIPTSAAASNRHRAAAVSNCTWKATVAPSPSGKEAWLSSVTGSSSDIWAVGSSSYNGVEGSTPLIEHFNGATWHMVAGPHPNQGNKFAWLNGAAAIGARDVWAVGSTYTNYTYVDPRIEHFDGTRWSLVHGPNPPSDAALSAVAGSSSADVWAVGTTAGQTLIEHWNGVSWRIVPSPNPVPGVSNVLFSVTAIGPKDAYAVGAGISGYSPSASIGAGSSVSTPQRSIVLHWNGARWTRVARAMVSGAEAVGVSPAAHGVWVVGSRNSGPPLAMRGQGASWTKVPVSKPSFGTAASLAMAGGTPWLVGSDKTGPRVTRAIAERWTGSGWEPASVPRVGRSGEALSSVLAVDRGLVAVGATDPGGYHQKPIIVERGC
jgi:hypothetical protein